MKVIALGLLFGLAAHAGVCKVESKIDTTLEQGVNKTTICEEVMAALTGSYNLEEEATLIVEANAGRGMYWVELSSIKYFVGDELLFSGAGKLVWYPGEAYVLIRE